jgi:uncharacterized protein (TIGR02246 family)
MKTALRLILVLACVSAVWAVQSKPPQAGDEQQKAIEKAVLEVHAGMMEAEKSRNAEKFFEFIADFDKGLIIQDGTLFKTRQEALDVVKAGFQRISRAERKYDQTYVTVLSPQAALVTASGTVTATTTDGQTISSQFAASMVFVQKDGQWKLLQGHYSMPNPR